MNDKLSQNDNESTKLPRVGSSKGREKITKKPANARKKRGKLFASVLGIIALAGLAGYGGAALQDSSSNGGFYQSSFDGNTQMTEEEQDITSAVNKVSKSVVSIVTEVSAQSPFGIQVGEGAGTGIIVSENGYILTNKHVIDGASDISIVTSDGTRYDDVSVVGTDPLNDIAFLKIDDAKNLPVAEIGDSSSARIAQEVIAIGNSLGQYQNTVTSGIISAKGRPVTAESNDGLETLTGLLQTDAAINPGNSGGPLINTSGQVIGVNTAMAAEAQGIGFAIPIDATKGMLKSLLETGRAERSYLGVNYLTVTPEVAKEYSLNVEEGAYVYAPEGTRAVVSGSPADEAGLKSGDIIIKVNDKVVGQAGVLSNLVAEYAPNETITFTVIRDGDTRTVDVTLGEYPA